MRLTMVFASVFALGLLVAGCSSSSNQSVTLSLKVADTSRLSNLQARGRSVQTESRSFTPSSFKLPIMKISISKSDYTNEQIVYQCPHSTEAQCLVDLASQTELDAISVAARGASIAPDTYGVIQLATCAAGSSGSTSTTAKVTGSGTGPDNGTWTTNATNAVQTSGGTAEETDVGNWSCSTKNVIIAGGFTVGSAALTVTVVVDNYMSAVFGNMVSSGMGGCKVGGGTDGLCVTYPALMAYVGTETATFKRFSIAHDSATTPADGSTANALIIVAQTASGTPLMAYGRTLFTATSESVAANTKASSLLDGDYTLATGGPTYVTETNPDSFTVNADGTVAFEQGGSTDTFAAKFSAFDVSASSTGTVTSKDGVDTWNYRATLIP